jgi:lipopolysaccharide/colanic/teichoic acid biosynthesis glycosyltransferase
MSASAYVGQAALPANIRGRARWPQLVVKAAQLLNVVAGSMSLVGPRPPLPAEVATYDDELRRRLVVKPGMTGLWQVSGRSDLPWPEAISLDLKYVENWSITVDLQILWKTVRAVATGAGAY